MAARKRKKTAKQQGPLRIVNRRARFEYTLLERMEAGVQLVGSEVKSVRSGHATLVEGYIRLDSRTSEAWLENVDIPPYPPAGPRNHTPRRARKLLLHRREIERLRGQLNDPGTTLVPLDIHLVRDRIKVEIGLARGKRKVDKREDMKKRTAERDMRRAMTRKVL